jgi:2-dehydro-3-deoxyphosphooctonate aldolase (KDO 8-P synthase)
MDNTMTRILSGDTFFIIAGPCAIEGRDMAFRIAEEVAEICERLSIPFVFKGSYRKANRSKLDSFTGIGDEKALTILKEVGEQFSVPVTTDIHESDEVETVKQFADVLQIPAFLCRQTALLQAAAESGKVVNIKKGQFMSPESMKFAKEKVESAGNTKVWLTERGTTFGYQDLVVDYRSIPIMRSFGAEVVMDCTHSLQQPNQSAGVTGGRPQLIETMACAAAAVGARALFIETHYQPELAKSDAANMLPLDRLERIVKKSKEIYQLVRDSDNAQL